MGEYFKTGKISSIGFVRDHQQKYWFLFPVPVGNVLGNVFGNEAEKSAKGTYNI